MHNLHRDIYYFDLIHSINRIYKKIWCIESQLDTEKNIHSSKMTYIHTLDTWDTCTYNNRTQIHPHDIHSYTHKPINNSQPDTDKHTLQPDTHSYTISHTHNTRSLHKSRTDASPHNSQPTRTSNVTCGSGIHSPRRDLTALKWHDHSSSVTSLPEGPFPHCLPLGFPPLLAATNSDHSAYVPAMRLPAVLNRVAGRLKACFPNGFPWTLSLTRSM